VAEDDAAGGGDDRPDDWDVYASLALHGPAASAPSRTMQRLTRRGVWATEALAHPLETGTLSGGGGRARRGPRPMHLSAHHHLETVQQDLMALIERENRCRKATIRVNAALHGELGAHPGYQWTDTPPELLKQARETVQVHPSLLAPHPPARHTHSAWVGTCVQAMLIRSNDLVRSLQELRARIQRALGQRARLRRYLSKHRQQRRPVAAAAGGTPSSVDRSTHTPSAYFSSVGAAATAAAYALAAGGDYRASPNRPRLNSAGPGGSAPPPAPARSAAAAGAARPAL
jgi:hypothetical protein